MDPSTDNGTPAELGPSRFAGRTRRGPSRIGELKKGGAIRGPAVAFLIVYCALLLLIPSQLIIRPIGAPGNPASLWGIFCLVWWACATIGGLNPSTRWTPVRVGVLILAVAVLASYASSMAHGWYVPVGIRQATDDVYDLVPVTAAELAEKMMTAADRGLLAFGGWLGIVLLASDGLRSWLDLERLIAWLSVFAAIVGAIGVIQFFTGLNIASLFQIPGLVANSDFGEVTARSVLRRVSSTAVHPIEFGVVLAAIFPLALHRCMFEWPKRWPLVPVAVLAFAIPMSVSRSAFIVLVIGIAVMFVGWPRRWKIRALIIVPFVAVVMRLLVPGLLGTIQSLFTNLFNDPSITGRTDDYDVVLGLYSDHFVLGRGLFTFVPRYYRTLDNQFLMTLIELGALGILAVCGFFLSGFLSARGAARRALDPRSKSLAAALSGGILGIVISYATFDAWGFPMAAGATFLLIGLAGAAWRLAVSDQDKLAVKYQSTDANPPVELTA